MLGDEILRLEQQLLRQDVRSSAAKIAELLAEGCVEHCSSGSAYRYQPGDTFPHGQDADWEITGFSASLLADGVVLATYRLTKHDQPDGKRHSLRSSIWKQIDGQWKMVFHQGTPCPA